MTFAPASEEKIKAIRGNGKCTLDYYAITAPWRDILTDDLILLLLLRGGTANDVFDQYLTQQAENNGMPLILPNYGSVSLGNDDDGEGMPWAPDVHLYASTLTFDFMYVQAFETDIKAEQIKSIKSTFQFK